MTTELLKQARDALAKSEPTGSYKNSMTAAKRHENLIKEIDAALAQPADEDAWFKKARELLKVFTHTMLDDYSECASAVNAESALHAHLRTRPQQAGFVQLKLPAAPTSRAGARFPAGSHTSRMYDATAVVVWYNTYEEADEAADLIDKAMIAAATKGDGK